MRSVLTRWVVAALVIAGCAPLEDVRPGECGNGVLDATEDCDGAAPEGRDCGAAGDGVDACRLVCGDDEECPAGWACRPEGICHRPTGAFAAAETVDLGTADWTLADVDGNGRRDVVGWVPGELRLWRPGGGVAHVRVPAATVRPAIVDLDLDGRDDVVAASRRGLVVQRGQADGTLEPVAFGPYAVSEAAEVWLASLRAKGVGPEDALLVVARDGDVVTFRLHLPDRTEPHTGSTFIEGVPDLADLGDRLAIADLDGDGDDEVALAVEGAREALVASTDRDVRTGDLVLLPRWRVLALPGQWVLDGGAHLADLDGDGALDLAAPARARDGARTVLVSRSDGHGALDPLAPDPRFGPLPPLALGDVTGDGRADAVFPQGVQVADGDLLRPEDPLAAPRPWDWREAVVADVTSDDIADVVAVTDMAIEIVAGSRDGRFTSLLVPRDRRPTGLRAEDLDADGGVDIVWHEGSPPSSEGGEVAVLFGGRDGWPSQVVETGPIGEIGRLELGRFRRSAGVDEAFDVVATVRDPSGGWSAAVIDGSADRVLFAPYVLLRDTTEQPPLAVLAGALGDAALLVLAGERDASSVWMVDRSTDRGLGDAHVGEALSALMCPNAHLPPGGRHECLPWARCAIWVTGDTDGDGSDEVLGAAPRAGCELSTLQPPAIGDLRGGGSGRFGAAPAEPPVDLGLVDLDGDGDADLVWRSADGLTVSWADPDPATRAVTALATLDGSPPQAIGAIDADADGRLDLAVGSSSGVWRAERTDDGEIVPAERWSPLAASRLEVGDADGDGLPDLWIGDGLGTVTVLHAVSHLEALPAP